MMSMAYNTHFQTADIPTVNTQIASQTTVVCVYLRNFMIAQLVTNSYEYKLLCATSVRFIYSTSSLLHVSVSTYTTGIGLTQNCELKILWSTCIPNQLLCAKLRYIITLIYLPLSHTHTHTRTQTLTRTHIYIKCTLNRS